jgi:hypothetical protein
MTPKESPFPSGSAAVRRLALLVLAVSMPAVASAAPDEKSRFRQLRPTRHHTVATKPTS